MIDFWKECGWGSKIFIVILLIVVVALVTPFGRTIWNRWFFNVQKADDITDYGTIRHVEDTCRAMITSYTADKMTWEQYRDSAEGEQRGWADQAKMRANKTAASYNEYVLKNSFVWEGNIPKDIQRTLEYLR